jgi:hypothetical protein
MSVIVAVIESNFRKYLTACEYLQIDPAVAYESRLIKERADLVLSQGNDGDAGYEELHKIVTWFVRHFERLTDVSMFGNKFAARCDRMVKMGKLKIHAGTVNGTYVKKELRHDNYDAYAKIQSKVVWFAVAMAAAIITMAAVLTILRG